MNTSTKSRSRSLALVQPLEGRRLLSGSWTTVDTDPTSYNQESMAADNFGNVYATGIDNANHSHLRQETGGVWSTVLTDGAASFNAVATDAAGNVFIAGNSASGATIWERPVGQSNFAVIDSMANGSYGGIATDAAGDVFVTGMVRTTTTIRNKISATNTAIVRKLAPAAGGSFTASTSVLGTSFYVGGISVVGSGAAAGVYVTGTSTDYKDWDVFKSADGTGSWSLVDQFRYNASYGSDAGGIAADAAGNVYVCGDGYTSVVTGTSHGKPVYSSTRSHWLVRKSGNGNSGSWSTVDDYLPAGATDAYAAAMGRDLAGNLYVVGAAGAHAVIRTNTGGSWSTSDDYTGPAYAQEVYTAFAADSNGNLYASGEDSNGETPTFVRSTAGPAPSSTTLTASLFSSASIASDSKTAGSRAVEELFAA